MIKNRVEKSCSHCKVIKPLDFFYTTGKLVNGNPKYNSWCKDCTKEKMKSYHKRTWGKEKLHRVAFLRTKSVKSYLIYLLGKAKRRKECLLKIDDLIEKWEYQNGKCALTGWYMTFILGKGKIPTNVSIDRINPQKNYTKENTQLVCACVNVAKMQMTQGDFVNMCNSVIVNNFF